MPLLQRYFAFSVTCKHNTISPQAWGIAFCMILFKEFLVCLFPIALFVGHSRLFTTFTTFHFIFFSTQLGSKSVSLMHIYISKFSPFVQPLYNVRACALLIFRISGNKRELWITYYKPANASDRRINFNVRCAYELRRVPLLAGISQNGRNKPNVPVGPRVIALCDINSKSF